MKKQTTKFVRVLNRPATWIEVKLTVPDQVIIDKFRERQRVIEANGLLFPDKKKYL